MYLMARPYVVYFVVSFRHSNKVVIIYDNVSNSCCVLHLSDHIVHQGRIQGFFKLGGGGHYCNNLMTGH